MNLKIIFFFILFPILSFSQSYLTIGIKENHNIEEIRIGDEIISNEEPSKFFTYIYYYNKTKDTILFCKYRD